MGSRPDRAGPSFGILRTRTKREMRQKFGLKADALNSLVTDENKISRGWRRAPRSLLGESPTWIFP